ncbi:Tbc1d1, partial [Symbiodinium sp. KB8]
MQHGAKQPWRADLASRPGVQMSDEVMCLPDNYGDVISAKAANVDSVKQSRWAVPGVAGGWNLQQTRLTVTGATTSARLGSDLAIFARAMWTDVKKPVLRWQVLLGVLDLDDLMMRCMNFIVTALLWHCMAEEAVFWLFVATVHNYDLRSMFEAPDMHGLKVRSFTIAQLVHQEMPDLSAHLAEHMQNSLSLLFTEWLLTLFAGSMPLTPLAILWDHFFQEGYSVIYRLILARLRCLRPWLLAETDFGVLVHLVKNAHLDFIGPDCRPWPRPARPGLPGFAVEESSPKRGEGVSRSAHT